MIHAVLSSLMKPPTTQNSPIISLFTKKSGDTEFVLSQKNVHNLPFHADPVFQIGIQI